MKYGYFNDTNKEYVITNPKTPVKWINYIGDLRFGGFVDHTGGALICREDPALNRIVKYIPQLPSSEFKGETLYLRIKGGSGYTVFSPFFVPSMDQIDMYECHVGLGYTKIISEFYGIRTEVAIFVPLCSNREIRDIRVTNLRNKPVSIDIVPVVEYTHFDALKQFTNGDWVPQTMQSRVLERDGHTILMQYAFMNKDTCVNYFTANRKADSFETDRNEFLGENGYGTWENPLSLRNKKLRNTQSCRGDNIASMIISLGELKIAETCRVITQLGQCSSIDGEIDEIKKYWCDANVDKAFEELKDFWDGYLSGFHVETPDSAFNTMVNVHNPKQCYITYSWSRYLSLYQLGFGSRGIGFRDTAQDCLGVMGLMPYEAAKTIKKLLMMQKIDGSAMHQFNPYTLIANEGDARERDDRPMYYGDDHLWIILAVCSYIKETGDTEILHENIPYYDKDKCGTPVKYDSIIGHLKAAVEFTVKNTGRHGLPLLGFADWNDTVNLAQGAESVFIAELFGYALKELIGLFEYINDKEWAQRCREYYDSMKKAFNLCSWDENWYVRYFDYDGSLIGSNSNSEGKIYTNAQSWAVVSGFADNSRGRKALDSVSSILNTRNGIKLSWPGYKSYDAQKGGVTTYPPGAKENGGIFLHCNPWVIIAETLMGNGNRAYKYYNEINPVLKNDIIDEYECEPYVYAQNILGDEHQDFGAARNSWLTGTASWAYQAAVNYILGVTADYNGLKINPCIPSGWDGFSVTRRFRNAVYAIKVKNLEGVCSGVKTIKVDGAIIKGNTVPVFDDGQAHEVVVLLGV